MNRVRSAEKWFDWHNNALARINQLHKSNNTDASIVKIAILGSGIALSQYNEDMYNFEPRIQYQDWVDGKSTWQDDAGHGTHLAVLIRKIAPRAMVHVGRVFKEKPTQESASTIAQAIMYFVDEWAVDIIVLPFWFEEKNDDINRAIRHAAFNSVLMFAAASNDGKNRPDGVAWPARDSRVICVHSADGLGNRSKFTPDPQDGMRIMVLGEGIQSAWPPQPGSSEDHKPMSGTPYSALIAAGIAAMILDYARGFLSEAEWEKLRDRDSMLRLFDRMKSPYSTDGYWWIMHWRLFLQKTSEGWIQGEIRNAFL